MPMDISAFFHEDTFSVTYLIVDSETGKAAVIDPVLDFDLSAARVATTALDRLAAEITARGLDLRWILETHPHADHLTGAARLQDRLGGRIGIGQGIVEVQKTWCGIYGLDGAGPSDGEGFDRLFGDGERIALGGLEITAMATPGHTPACVTYLVGDAAFVGDAIFMPDFGTARVDFPSGDAAQLYQSIGRILALPADTRLFVGHDYGPGGRAFCWETTVAAQRAENKHVREGIGREDFVAMRLARDKDLAVPGLLLPALQVNIRGGRLPPTDPDGRVFLRIPVDRF